MHMPDAHEQSRTVATSCFLVLIVGALASGDAAAGNLHANKPARVPSMSPAQDLQPLGPGVLETDADEYGPTLSADGAEIYFVRRQNRRGAETIMVSTRSGDGWSAPVAASFSDTSYNKEPYLSPDGQRLFFSSTRGGSGEDAFDIFMTTRTTSGWSDPVRLADTVNSESYDNYPAVAANGNLYFGSRRDGGERGTLDLYVARWADGAYQPAENLGAPINTPSTEADPYIAPDESFLLFISTKAGGHGSGDLYISRRTADGWSEPENLGPTVNGDDFDYTPFVSADGATLYFSRGWGEMWMTSFAPWRQ
jgi:Tol biopolymer transport system component